MAYMLGIYCRGHRQSEQLGSYLKNQHHIKQNDSGGSIKNWFNSEYTLMLNQHFAHGVNKWMLREKDDTKDLA